MFRRAYRQLSGNGLRNFPGSSFVSDALFQVLFAEEQTILIEGSRFFVDPWHSDPAMRKTFQTYALFQTHEPSTTRIVRNCLRPGDIAFDVGANIGYFTLLFASIVGHGGKVLAFEPEPRNFEYLKHNIKLNRYHRVNLIHGAILDDHREVKLYFDRMDTGHHTILQHEPETVSARAPVTVQGFRLDEFYSGDAELPCFVKMDVEGSEPLAFRGMGRLLEIRQPLTVVVEYFPFTIRNMGLSVDTFASDLFDRYHFKVSIIPGDYDAKSASSPEELRSATELIRSCPRKLDHLNLLLEK